MDSPEKWDDIDVPKKVLKRLESSREKSDKGTTYSEKYVKSIICAELSKIITKQDLESLGAWDEVSGWFRKISELVSKASSK